MTRKLDIDHRAVDMHRSDVELVLHALGVDYLDQIAQFNRSTHECRRLVDLARRIAVQTGVRSMDDEGQPRWWVIA